MLRKLKHLEGAQSQAQMQQIVWYLVGKDGSGGKLDLILSTLKAQDRKNALR